MKFTLEDLYQSAGKDDKTAGLCFNPDSESYKKYGNFITVVFKYTQCEREEMDERIKVMPYSGSGFIKADYYGLNLSDAQIEMIKKEGINSDDIIDIWPVDPPLRNVYHSVEKRAVKRMDIPFKIQRKGRDIDWMYGFTKRLVQEGTGICPEERNFYLAGKYYYERASINEEESSEIFVDGKMKEEIEWELLSIKYEREEINNDELNRMYVLLSAKKVECIGILDKYLIEAGSSLKKLLEINPYQAAEMFDNVSRFRQHRFNVTGKVPIYLDLDRYLHIYMRHVEEMKVNEHFEHKDNFQWNQDDVFWVMETIIQKMDEEIQHFFESNPGKRFSLYGDHSYYLEGDYYTFHIEPNGLISTFHKNNKEHEEKST
jgi:hypothetical protein